MTAMDFPSSPINGQTTADGRYYFDSSVGTAGGWRSTPLPVGGLPAGSIMAWGTNTPPANWLLADGSAVSRSVYSSLFAVIGTQYGTGDGTTTFNLPDLRGRVPVGKNGGTFGTLGATGGSETHSHSNGSLAAGGTFFTAGGGVYFDYNTKSTDSYSENVRAYWPTNGSVGALSPEGSSSGIAVYGSTSSASSLAPYQVVNYIIKASAGWTAGDSELATRIGVLEQTRPLSPNYIINGGFDIWQRGTSSTTAAAGYRTADRWATWISSGSGTIQQDTTYPAPGCENGIRFTSSGAGSNIVYYYTLETKDAVKLAGKTASFSLYLASPSGKSVQLSIWSSTTTDNAFTGSWDAVSSVSVTGTSTVTRQSLVGSIPANAKTVQVRVFITGVNNTEFASFSGVQLEEGSNPTSFRRNAPSIQAELAACQRYYQLGAAGASGRFNSTTAGEVAFKFAVRMRATPSVAHLANYTAFRVGITPVTVTNTGTNGINEQGCCLTLTTSNVAAGDFALIPGNASESVAFSAEL